MSGTLVQLIASESPIMNSTTTLTHNKTCPLCIYDNTCTSVVAQCDQNINQQQNYNNK